MISIKQLDRILAKADVEHRVPIHEAWHTCDGTPSNFEQELYAQSWEHPNLPVQEIMQRLTSNC